MTTDPREDMTRGGLSVRGDPVHGGGMPNEKMLPCYTCGRYEPHRRPRDDRERNHIRKLRQLKPHAFVDDYWICVTTDRDCRNIRYAWVDNPFNPPEKMPEPE